MKVALEDRLNLTMNGFQKADQIQLLIKDELGEQNHFCSN